LSKSPQKIDHVSVKGLVVRAGDTPLLQGMSLRLQAGSISALVGPSGAGKSLTARACLGLLKVKPGVVSGTVEVQQGDEVFPLYGRAPRWVWRRSLKAIRGNAIGLLPQAPADALDPLVRVDRQVAQVLRLTGEPGTPADVLRVLRQAGFDEPEHAARCYPHELSGGMAQRVCIAQALARRSAFLIADEPVTGLDPGIAQSILDRLRILADLGVGVLLITHDLRMVRRVADHVHVIHRGRVIEELSPEQLMTSRHPVTQSLVEATAKVAGGWS
jgi:ABC-type glutathione transport system ATPase component